MRVHLLLILFFATTILARSTRNKRDTNVTTVEPPHNPTTEANNESTTTNVTGDKCNGNNCGNNIPGHPLKMMSVFIKSTLIFINEILLMFLRTLNSTDYFILRIIMLPFVEPLRMMITILKWMLHFI